MNKEKEAIDAIRAAIRAIVKAEQAAEDAGYGSQVAAGLAQAFVEANYALAVAEGRA